jgi:4-hydroxy-2-oxoheptanedioate aldolase
MVDSREEAERLAAAVRYPPLGFRGLAGSVRAARYGRERDYAKTAAAQTCLMVQIESPRAVEAAAEIAAVDGVDALFVGPGDLSAGMGRLGEPRHPEVAAAIARVLEAGASAGKPVGTFGLDAEDALHRFEQGFRFVSVATDSRLVLTGAEAALARVRGG